MPSSEGEQLVTLEQLIFLHIVVIVEFGGLSGLRDRGLAESALAWPLAGFGGESIFSTPFERAAALMEALIRNHPFVDGNKRVAVMAAAFWLEQEGFGLEVDQDELVDVTLNVVTHAIGVEELAVWLKSHSAPPKI